MAKYIFAYHGGKKPESEEAMQEMMARWQAWIGNHGDAMTDPGNPVGMSKTVSSGSVADDGGSNPLSGYSMVEADDMDAALAIAKGCPHVDHGTIEVAEIMEVM